MKATSIKALSMNIIFIIGVVLTVIGFVNGTSAVVRTIVFDQYPLNTYDEDRCSQTVYAPMLLEKRVADEVIVPDSVEKEQQLQECERSLAHSRKVKQVNDYTISFSMLIAGLALTRIFKGFLFEKK